MTWPIALAVAQYITAIGANNQAVLRDSDRNSCLIHAYLHRVEGDNSNARYWYRKTGETMPDNTLDEELERLLGAIGGKGNDFFGRSISNQGLMWKT